MISPDDLKVAEYLKANYGSTLGDRMKFYENIECYYLAENSWNVLRIDGKAFHTFTRGFKKPFDHNITEAMDHATLKLCEHIQGAQIGYTQSDEISIIFNDIGEKTQMWFGGKIQKIVSVAASIATASFNDLMLTDTPSAFFDARVFSIPEDEVEKYLLWRLKDSRKNAVSVTASSVFSPKQLHGKNTTERLEMLGDLGVDLIENQHRNYSGAVVERVLQMSGDINRFPWVVKPVTPTTFIGKIGTREGV